MQGRALKAQMDKIVIEHRKELEMTVEKCRREDAAEEKLRAQCLCNEREYLVPGTP